MKTVFNWCRFALGTAVLLLLAGGFAVSALAQQTWERTYGGADNDEGYSVQQTTDGGYIVAGYTNSFGNALQVYLVKTNASGDTLWTKTYGGTNHDYGLSVRQTSDGGYIVAGMTLSFGAGNYDVYLTKTNASGDTLWTKTYGGTNDEWGYSVQQTSDGGYIVAGYTNSFGDSSQVYFVKTNASGDTIWTRTYGGTRNDAGQSVQQTLDGGYIIAGGTQSFGAGGYDVYVIKTNASGDTLWTRTYGGTRYDVGWSVQQTTDGGYIVAGRTGSFGNGAQVYLVKTNASGDTLWTKTYGRPFYDEGYSVQQTTDGGYIVAGWTFNVYDDVCLIKTDDAGDTIWTRTYGGTNDDEGYSVQQTSDGGYIIAGLTYSFGAGEYDVYLIKTDANGNVGIGEENQISRIKNQKLRIVTNPFVSFTAVLSHENQSFALFDISGRQVGIFRGNRIGAGLAAGVYFIQAETGLSAPQRIVKIR